MYFLNLSLVVAAIHCNEPSISGSLPGINIHVALCINHRWLNVGVERAAHEVDPFAHISKLIWDLLKEIVHCWVYTRFYKSEYFFAQAIFCMRTYSFSMDRAFHNLFMVYK